MAHPITHEEPSFPKLGRYELVSRIGRGGMAEVYEARLPGVHGVAKKVALKRILPEALTDPHFVKLFVREARLCTRLAHPNLIQVFELAQEQGELFLAMELVEGCDLRRVMRAQQELGKTMPVELALFAIHGVLQGLEYAHRLTDEKGDPLGVVHRDLSPSNILVSYAGNVKVADFGVAHVDGPEKSDANLLKGKVSYMAPEQLTAQSIDERVDVFAAACVLFELLSGQPVYGGKVTPKLVRQVAKGEVPRVAKAIPHIDPALAEVIQRALASKPADRTPTCERFDEEIQELVQAGKVRCAREPDLALYLEVLVPREDSGALVAEPPSAASPTVESKKPPPEPVLILADALESVVQPASNVLELHTGDLEPPSNPLRAPEPHSIGDLFDLEEANTPLPESEPGAVVLRLTPAPVQRPQVEFLPLAAAAEEEEDVEPLRRWPRVLLAVLLIGAVAGIAWRAGRATTPLPAPRASPGVTAEPDAEVPFEAMPPPMRLDHPELKVALPEVTPTPAPPPPRRIAKKTVKRISAHW